MRKLVSQLFVSLDGVVESLEQWHLSYYNEELQAAVDAQIVESDILLRGAPPTRCSPHPGRTGAAN